MRFFLLTFLICIKSWSNTLEVYGRLSGSNKPQLLSLDQVKSLQTITNKNLPTWLVVVSELNTAKPKLHIVDTDYFKNIPSQYGLHEAYSRTMGLVSSPADFIDRMKASKGKARTLMPYTLYLVSQTKNSSNSQFVLQNRRYVFEDNSDLFVSSLVKSQIHIKSALPFLQGLPSSFVTYEKADSFRRPNLLTNIGKQDIELLLRKGFGILNEEELTKAEYLP